MDSRARLLFFLAIAATLAAYWSGLSGPFLLDDEPNLSSIPLWLSDQLGLSTLLFERGGGTFGRPVSMASFALNARIFGFSPFVFKAGNLLVHIACGLLVFVLLRRLLRKDPNLAERAPLYASLAASVWLLHPLHASTVLYVVQRMAQLSTLLTLLGLWLYVLMRDRLEHKPSPYATMAYLAVIPVVTTTAFLAKENGILLPLLCGVVELAYYRKSSRPRSVQVFFWAYLLVPAVVAVLALVMHPERIMAGFSGRDFTLTERLLTQGRAICDYLVKLLAPNPSQMGVYTDDFAVSTSLLIPSSTWLCLLLILAISMGAWFLRKRLPSVFFGWSFFLAAHALEAGPVPLELYFEHRNYLPSVGIILAVIALITFAFNWLHQTQAATTRLGPALSAIVLLLLAVGVHGRALIWQDERLIAESSLLAHPYSLRANGAVLSLAIAHGDKERANEVIEHLLSSPLARHRSVAHLYRFYATCVLEGRSSHIDLEAFSRTTPVPLTHAETIPLRFIYSVTQDRKCNSSTDGDIGRSLAALADRAVSQPDSDRPKLVVRYYAAQFFVRDKDWKSALGPARLAWQDNAEPGIAMPLVLAQLGTRDIAGAKKTWLEIAQRSDRTSKTDQDGLLWLHDQIESASRAYSQPASLDGPSGARH